MRIPCPLKLSLVRSPTLAWINGMRTRTFGYSVERQEGPVMTSGFATVALVSLAGLMLSISVWGAASPHMDAPPSGPAVVIPDAQLVNIYWDANWDTNVGDRNLTRAHIDAFMEALVQSEYFGGLSQYGVQSVSFVGSIDPAAVCGSTAPSKLTAQIIAQFVTCQARTAQMPGSLVNVFVPPTTTEDSARPAALCGGDPRFRYLFSYHGSTQRGGGIPFSVVAVCVLSITRESTPTLTERSGS
jgi:hypothetical protein